MHLHYQKISSFRRMKTLISSIFASRDFFSIFEKGPLGPLVWEFYPCLATNWENSQMQIFQSFYKVCLELHVVI